MTVGSPGQPRKPPPPPPLGVAAAPGASSSRSRFSSGGALPPPRPPMRTPAHGEHASQAIKDQICEMALGLLEEQVQARIVHYKADLETNPELDAITAEVVAQLKKIQAQAQAAAHGGAAREAVRDSHERIFCALLQRVFPAGAPSLLVEKRLKEIHRKLARLFFQSELHEKTRGKDGAIKVIQHGEQAIFYLLARYENRLRNELGAFDYASEEVKERAAFLLAKIGKDMQDAFLSRRSSELKRIVSAFHSVLVDFFCKQLAAAAPELAREVVHQAATFEGRAFAYKITADAFPRFRTAFERRLMVRLVGFAEDQLLRRLADTAGTEREETVQFITDPRVFSMILGELCEGLYEFLCNEGFLDLPVDWRKA
ncbi:MAG: hypothetical protein ABI134_01720 [Byssovorax sp.]